VRRHCHQGRVCIVALGLALVGSTAVTRAEPEPGAGGAIPTPATSRPRIAVRLYDSTRLDTPVRKAAVGRTAQLLGAAGLTLQFHDCTPGVNMSRGACDASRSPDDLIIRFVRSRDGPSPATRHVLGFATIDGATRRGTMATVFTDRVAALSSLARLSIDTLLGRTIAHEIGHLLLGTNEHGANGLMREVWTLDELAGGRNEHWTFTAAELARLRGPA
jgi:hypothetical protein